MAHVVVGLGNPGPKYEGTRHNVGHRVLDDLAHTLRARFHPEGPALLARGQWRGESVHLLKPQSFMNVSGGAIAAALRRLGADPADLIVVYDDIDMALGKVRLRMKGSSGGHNGMRSIIGALGTDQIRRVKIGVGRPERKEDVADHVLDRFDEDELPVVDAAVTQAASRVLELIAR